MATHPVRRRRPKNGVLQQPANASTRVTRTVRCGLALLRLTGRFTPAKRAALLALALLACLPAEAQNDWVEYRSEHYTIFGDADPDEVRRIVADLEGFQGATARFFRTAGLRSLPPTTVLVLDGDGDLRRAGLERSREFFIVGPDRAFALVTDPDRGESFEELLYQYFLVIAGRSIPNAPLWVREGLAAFYRTTRWSGDGDELVTGLPIEPYLGAVRDERSRIGFGRLSEVSSLSEFGDAEVFRAQAWALTHYLMTREGGAGHDQTAELVRRMASGSTFDESAADAFGLESQALLAGFDAWLDGRETPPRLTLAMDRQIGAMTRVGEVPQIDAATTIGAVLVAADRTDEAEVQLGRAIAMDRLAFGPYIALAPLLIEQGRFDEVRYGMDTAMRRDDPPYLGRYYYALSLIRENPEPSPAALARLRRDLETAIDLNPDFADAYHQLAASFLGTGDGGDEAMRLLERALELSPENPDYLVTYSRFLIAQGRFDDARDILEALVDRGLDADARDRATQILQSIAGRTGGRGLVGEGFAEIRTNTGRSVPEPPTAASAAGEPAGAGPSETGDGFELTRVVEGEQQAGLLTLVDCREGLALTVEDGQTSRVFFTDSPERVEFSTSAAANLGREIRCGVQDPPIRVVVTFRPGPEGSESAGVPVRVDFVEER